MKLRPLSLLALLIIPAAAVAADPASLPTPPPLLTGPLFNGKDLTGWKVPQGTWRQAESVTLNPVSAKIFNIKAGTGIVVNTNELPTVDLFTELEHGDCELHVEFCVPQGSNSGVYLQGRYEVQIFDSYGKKEVAPSDCGGLYEGQDNGKGFPGKAPAVNASKAPGEWQTFDIIFRAPRFAGGRKSENARFIKVTHNGQVIHENVEVTNPTRSAAFSNEASLGPLKLQGDHGPVAYRNLKLTPLKN